MKITSSTRKLADWARIRELDRRALELLAAGADLDAAYRQAIQEENDEKLQADSRPDRVR